jgi:hypothetical protein
MGKQQKQAFSRFLLNGIKRSMMRLVTFMEGPFGPDFQAGDSE